MSLIASKQVDFSSGNIVMGAAYTIENELLSGYIDTKVAGGVGTENSEWSSNDVDTIYPSGVDYNVVSSGNLECRKLLISSGNIGGFRVRTNDVANMFSVGVDDQYSVDMTVVESVGHVFINPNTALGTVAIGDDVNASGRFSVDQQVSTAARSVLNLKQADISEPSIRFVGTSEQNEHRTIVDATDVGTSVLSGYIQVDIKDDAGRVLPPDGGKFYIPIYAITAWAA